MTDREYYSNWEWQPIERMSNGCSEVIMVTREKCVPVIIGGYQKMIKNAIRHSDLNKNLK